LRKIALKSTRFRVRSFDLGTRAEVLEMTGETMVLLAVALLLLIYLTIALLRPERF
jgi:K+-transporting ATPase KdpF subunit